jgi:hypothetical protein
LLEFDRLQGLQGCWVLYIGFSSYQSLADVTKLSILGMVQIPDDAYGGGK